MAKTYADIQKEIESLQKTAESLRQKEVAGVVERIKAAIATYQLSAADLGFGARTATAAAPRGKAKRGRKAAAPKGAAVYRHADGRTWSGRGRRPAWINEALQAGKSLDDFRA